MRELKDGTYIIGVDHGYGNIKTANTVTPTGIQAYDTEPIFQGNNMIYKGKYYRFGDGHKNFISDKTEDEDFYMFTLFAIAKELQRTKVYTANVHIATGLPLTWVRSQRESFREYLMRNPSVEFNFNGKDFKVNIVGCNVFPQGYSAIIDRLNEFSGDNILADIGNGTMNIMYLFNKKPVENKCWTEKLGVNKCIMRIRNVILDNYGVETNEKIIEQYLRFGNADVSEKYIKLFHKAAVEYTKDFFDVLKKYEYDPDTVQLHIIGGGGCIIRNFADYDRKRVKINSDICAAAKGYEMLAYMLKNKEKKNE